MSRARLTIEHTFYGCESGCCGHRMTVEVPADVPDAALPKDLFGEPVCEPFAFFFEHAKPGEDAQAFAKGLIERSKESNTYLWKVIDACGGYEIASVEIVDSDACTW